tara:strand:+ start:315 stop:575 length:261 start_codon:yes stop_codon:yes gene_type:complete
MTEIFCYTVSEVCSLLKVDRSVVDTLMHDGTLNVFFVKEPRITAESIENLIGYDLDAFRVILDDDDDDTMTISMEQADTILRITEV